MSDSNQRCSLIMYWRHSLLLCVCVCNVIISDVRVHLFLVYRGLLYYHKYVRFCSSTSMILSKTLSSFRVTLASSVLSLYESVCGVANWHFEHITALGSEIKRSVCILSAARTVHNLAHFIQEMSEIVHFRFECTLVGMLRHRFLLFSHTHTKIISIFKSQLRSHTKYICIVLYPLTAGPMEKSDVVFDRYCDFRCSQVLMSAIDQSLFFSAYVRFNSMPFTANQKSKIVALSLVGFSCAIASELPNLIVPTGFQYWIWIGECH